MAQLVPRLAGLNDNSAIRRIAVVIWSHPNVPILGPTWLDGFVLILLHGTSATNVPDTAGIVWPAEPDRAGAFQTVYAPRARPMFAELVLGACAIGGALGRPQEAELDFAVHSHPPGQDRPCISGVQRKSPPRPQEGFA
jgi:hypothetical protein